LKLPSPNTRFSAQFCAGIRSYPIARPPFQADPTLSRNCHLMVSLVGNRRRAFFVAGAIAAASLLSGVGVLGAFAKPAEVWSIFDLFTETHLVQSVFILSQVILVSAPVYAERGTQTSLREPRCGKPQPC